MTAPEAEPGFALLDPPGSTWENRVAGRIALTVGAYRPYAKFHKLRQPVFVAVCDEDDTTPAAPAVKAAEESPNAELVRYPIGHFEIYVDPQFETTVADQTDFLVRNLVGGRVPVPAWPRPRRPPRGHLLGRPVLPAARDDLLEAAHAEDEEQRAKPTPKANAPIAICWPTE